MTPAELDELKSRNSCAEVAERLGVRLRPYGREKIGSCPICSTDLQDRTATRWQTKGGSWVCAASADGGDVIALVQKALSLDFLGAVEWLGGISRTVDHRAEEARAKATEREQEKKAAEAERYRERERRALYGLWERALDPPGTLVEVYLDSRGLPLPPWPDGLARLR